MKSNRFVPIFVTIIAVCAIIPGLPAADDSPHEYPVKTSFIFVAYSGLMVVDKAFEEAEFYLLPEPEDKSKFARIEVCGSNYSGVLFVQYGQGGIRTCHFGVTGWTVQINKELRPDTIHGCSQGDFQANCTVTENEIKYQEVWIGMENNSSHTITWSLKSRIKYEPEDFSGHIGTGGAHGCITLRDKKWREINHIKIDGKKVIFERTSGPDPVYNISRERLSLAEFKLPKKANFSGPCLFKLWPDKENSNQYKLILLTSGPKNYTTMKRHIAYSEDSGKSWKFLFEKQWSGRNIRFVLHPE
ncbi:hypothetical protein ACFL54_07250 [Planctomycetota bacterium]